MTTQTTTVATRAPEVGSFDANDAKLVQYLGLDPADAKSRAVVAVCRHYSLDPLLKHVIVIPKGGVYITRDGYLHIAHASGQLDGIVVDQEPVLSQDGKEWVARVTVWRKDMTHPFTFPGRYPVAGQNREYAPEMALKAAEAHALRRAFNVAGLGSADERYVDDATEAAPPVTAAEVIERAQAVRNPHPPAPDPEAPPLAPDEPEVNDLRESMQGRAAVSSGEAIARHPFVPLEDDPRWCAECGVEATDRIHRP